MKLISFSNVRAKILDSERTRKNFLSVSRALGPAIFSALLFFSVSLPSYSYAFPLEQNCDPTQVHETTTPSLPMRQVQIQVFQDKIPLIRPPVEIVLIGDSLVQFWPEQAVKTAFPGKRVLNFGVGLDRTQHVMWRLQEVALKSIRPKAAVILVGTNNLKAGDSGCAISAGIEAVADKVSSLWPGILVSIIGIIPRGEDYAFRARDRLAINERLHAVAREHKNWRYLNIDDVISCGLVQPCQNYLDDYVHLSEAGYDIVGEKLRLMSSGRR